MARLDNKTMIKTYTAEDAVTVKRFVMNGTAETQCKMPTGAGVVPLGIAINGAAAGIDVEIQTAGFGIGIASAAIAKGALVRVAGTSGKVAAITEGVTTATRIAGVAMSAAAADGDEISIDLKCGAYAAV